MSEPRKLLRVERHRHRIALGGLATSELYEVHKQADGVIVLTPVKVVPGGDGD